jgi:hypothetical protein
MLKILLASQIPESFLSAPTGHDQWASQLAAAAGVSVMSAFRLVEELSNEGFLESGEGSLGLVRLRELMSRWQAASQRRVLKVSMRWVLHRGEKALRNVLRSYQAKDNMPSQDSNGHFSSPRPRVYLGLFEAAGALGMGFVHGLQPYIYVERLNDRSQRAGSFGRLSNSEAQTFTYAFWGIAKVYPAESNERTRSRTRSVFEIHHRGGTLAW